MANNQPTIINMAELLAPMISCRDTVEVLASAIGKVKTKIINLDFGQVEFVSRSVAHALLVLKEDLSRRLLRKKQIHFINASNDVETMFRAVAANRAIPKPKPTFNLEIVSINALV